MNRIRYGLAALLALSGCGMVTPPPAPTTPAAREPPPVLAATPPPPPPQSAPAKSPAPTPKAPAPTKPAATPAASAAPVPSTAAPAKPAAAPAAPPLDLKLLEQRLRETPAVGVLTKLSLKNQVDDLVAQFRAYHDGHRPPTLAELRRPYELLLMKVLALLQDKDSALAREINASRDAIWGVLSDRNQFAKSL